MKEEKRGKKEEAVGCELMYFFLPLAVMRQRVLALLLASSLLARATELTSANQRANIEGRLATGALVTPCLCCRQPPVSDTLRPLLLRRPAAGDGSGSARRRRIHRHPAAGWQLQAALGACCS